MTSTDQSGAPTDLLDTPDVDHSDVSAAIRLGEFNVTAVVRSTLRRWPGEIGPWWIEPVDYDIGSPTTAGLFRVRGFATDCGHTMPWLLFLKVIQSFRHWPLLHILPRDLRERARTDTTWRYEADVYTSDLAGTLPAGLRLPRVHQVDDLGEDRLALWLEDVATLDTPWDLPRFRRRPGCSASSPPGSPGPAACPRRPPAWLARATGCGTPVGCWWPRCPSYARTRSGPTHWSPPV